MGDQIGYWTIIAYAGRENSINYWTCKCVCGDVLPVRECALQEKRSKSCGCMQGELCRIAAAKRREKKRAREAVRASI